MTKNGNSVDVFEKNGGGECLKMVMEVKMILSHETIQVAESARERFCPFGQFCCHWSLAYSAPERPKAHEDTSRSLQTISRRRQTHLPDIENNAKDPPRYFRRHFGSRDFLLSLCCVRCCRLTNAYSEHCQLCKHRCLKTSSRQIPANHT